MCKSSNCEHPELRPDDGKCSEELIEKCHGKIQDTTNNCKCDQK